MNNKLFNHFWYTRRLNHNIWVIILILRWFLLFVIYLLKPSWNRLFARGWRSVNLILWVPCDFIQYFFLNLVFHCLAEIVPGLIDKRNYLFLFYTNDTTSSFLLAEWFLVDVFSHIKVGFIVIDTFEGWIVPRIIFWTWALIRVRGFIKLVTCYMHVHLKKLKSLL